MLELKVDETAIREMYLQAVNEKLEKVSIELTFWDTKELKRRTCLSWNTIQDTFFHEPDFPKIKLGGKWMFPAKETEEFLLNWINEKR